MLIIIIIIVKNLKGKGEWKHEFIGADETKMSERNNIVESGENKMQDTQAKQRMDKTELSPPGGTANQHEQDMISPPRMGSQSIKSSRK